MLKKQEKNKSVSIAIEGNAANVYSELLTKNFIPDIVTDQTSAHDLLYGYIPNFLSIEKAESLRKNHPSKYINYALS
ncbi:hypothetical protein [Natranaerobius trueperi]|uniref:hypothetical protein n=1 Tax=Natranaerobius trueperi TaxID=759412 RepID=UPI001303513B|nr:hypothetical protein [Natranaerobius trueperi]